MYVQYHGTCHPNGTLIVGYGNRVSERLSFAIIKVATDNRKSKKNRNGKGDKELVTGTTLATPLSQPQAVTINKLYSTSPKYLRCRIRNWG